MVHKRCHKYINLQCDQILAEQHQQQQAAALASASSNHSILSTNSHSNGNSYSVSEAKIKNNVNSAPNTNGQSKQQQQNGLKTSSPIQEGARTKSSLSSSLKNNKFSSQTAALINTEKKKQAPTPDQSNNNLKLQHSTPISAGPVKKFSESTVDANSADPNSKQIGLENFDLIKVIGRGSYAKVFLVEYKKTKKCYAMKVIKKSICDDDEDIDWVQTEKHVFEQATNHPFLVGLHSCFQTESRLFFVIEYLCGGDLMYHMQKKRRLPEDHARFYSAEICIALGFLHSKGIIYRDLKLDNVLLDIEGHVKLTDYGMLELQESHVFYSQITVIFLRNT